MKVIFPDSNTALLAEGKAVVSFGQPGASPTQPIVKDSIIVQTQDIVPWGSANNFPQEILKRARKSTIIPTALNWKANLLSTPVVPFNIEYDDDGKEKPQYVRDPEILEFINNRHFRRYLSETANDIFWFLNTFPELIISKDRKKITHIHPNEAAYCRIGVQNKQGVSEFTYVNANWPWASSTDAETTKIRTLDPYQYDLVGWARDQHSDVFKFIFPSSYPTPGNTFYQLAHWDGIRTSGWLDVLEKVPVLKKALFDNQMVIKYHIKIPREYWANEFGDQWSKATADQRDEIRKNKMTEINRRLVGAENAGIALATEFGISAIDGKTIEGWVIEALPDKLKDGSYLADNMEATAHLMYALGIDPTLFGFASKEQGARSGGSDKREALLIYLSQLQAYRNVLYEPLDFVAEYNGWKKKYPMLQFRSQQTLLTTLDTGADAKKVAA
ncbi:hypothetical protein SAMN05216327_101196 [Dyadobacter sp. SG02]|uniref:hypothetical protein n=1 Tax=Dyadobacter sp. SG02 TaxID=1855291 RepID=UPI0008C8C37E|nr:hypothetical protein [Dyadobacter sp. SG02]SEI39437.1 hypothetical protein SAMN05216327_101196 [Dyadobacter sp. SG02]